MDTTQLAKTLERLESTPTLLSARSGVPRVTVYAHARGFRSIGQAHALAYADALGVPLEDILGPPKARVVDEAQAHG